MMAGNKLAVAALCLLALSCAAEAYNRGDGTAYSGYKEKDETGKNSCGFGRLDDRWERYYAALPSQVFDRSSDCGRCLRARGTDRGATGNWVTVMVVDECASCNGNGDVDFSTDALKEITGFAWDRKTIEWEWTSCDGGDSADVETKSARSADTTDTSADEEEPDCVKKSKRRNSDRRLLRA